MILTHLRIFERRRSISSYCEARTYRKYLFLETLMLSPNYGQIRQSSSKYFLCMELSKLNSYVLNRYVFNGLTILRMFYDHNLENNSTLNLSFLSPGIRNLPSRFN